MIALGSSVNGDLYLGSTKVCKAYLGSTLVYECIAEVLGVPFLTNFRLEDTDVTQIYFDSTSSIEDMTHQGFTYYGKSGSITGVFVNGSSTTGHYFTTNRTFNWADNILIDLVGGDGSVFPFTLEDVENNISLPTPTRTRYVTATATGTGDGSSGNPWTWEQSEAAIQGDIVYVKAGDYGSPARFWPNNNGSVASPIQFVGYKDTPGDITTNLVDEFTYTNNANLNTWLSTQKTEYPFIDGTNVSGSSGIYLSGKSGFVFKNIIINKRENGVDLRSSCTLNLFENVVVANCFRTNDEFGRGFNINETGGGYIRFKKCGVYEVELAGFFINGTSNKSEYCTVATGNTGQSGEANGCDYYWNMNECLYSSVVHSYAQRTFDMGQNGHGFGGKAYNIQGTGIINKCLFADNRCEGLQNESLFIGYPGATENVFKRNSLYGWARSLSESNHLFGLREACSGNIFEQNIGENAANAIYMADTAEEGDNGLPNNNIIRNNILFNVGNIFKFTDVSGSADGPEGNEIYNNTFDNANYFIWNQTSQGSANAFTSNMVTKITSYLRSGSNPFTETYNNYWGNGFSTPSGTGNQSVDPNYVDSANGDFEPQAPFDTIDAPAISGIYTDYEGSERNDTATTIGAIIHKDEVVEPPPAPSVPAAPTDLSLTVGDIVEHDYYVSADGTGVGTLADPMSFASAKTAISTMQPGETMAFKGGDEFYGNLSISAVNGTSGNPITFTSYGTGKAVIKGSKTVTGFTTGGGDIWTASTGADVPLQVMNGGVPITNARFPVLTDNYDRENGYATMTSVSSQTTFICTELIGQNVQWSTIHILDYQWTLTTRLITEFNSITGEVTIDSATPGTITTGTYFFVNNKFNLITQNDDWYYYDFDLHVGATSEPLDITIAVEDTHGIIVSDSDYITIDNLEVRDFNQAGINAYQTNGLIIKNTGIKNCYQYGVRLLTGTATIPPTIEDCTFDHIAYYGIYDPYNGSVIQRNTFTNQGVPSMITSVGLTEGVPIHTYGDNVTITENTISNAAYNGIHFEGQNSTVTNNFIQEVCLMKHDGAGIYTKTQTYLGTGAQNSTVEYNTVLNDYFTGNWQVDAIYMDDNAHDVTVRYNNVEGGFYSIYLHNTQDITLSYNKVHRSIQNNLLLREDGVYGGEGTMVGNVVSNNVFYTNNSNNEKRNLWVVSDYSSVLGFGTYNNNTYYSAYAGDVARTALNNFSSIAEYTLSEWQTYSSQDANSTANSVSNPTEESFFAYNETSVAKDVILPAGTWDSVDGTQTNKTGTVNVPAYSSYIMIKQ